MDYSIEYVATQALGVNAVDFAYRVENGTYWDASYYATNVTLSHAETLRVVQFSFLSQNSCLDVLTWATPRFEIVEELE